MGIEVFDNGMTLDQRFDQTVRKEEVLWGENGAKQRNSCGDGDEIIASVRDRSGFHAVLRSNEEDLSCGVNDFELIGYGHSWAYVAAGSASSENDTESFVVFEVGVCS